MKIELNRNIWWIVLFGSLWGLMEASLGFLLHQFSMSAIAGHIMMPVGFSLIMLCYRKCDSAWGIPFMAGIAAQVKMINLLMGAPAPAVFNPVFSILAMGALLMICMPKVDERGLRSVLPVLGAVSLSWSILHQLWGSVATYFLGRASIVDLSGAFQVELVAVNSVLVFTLFALAYMVVSGIQRKAEGFFQFSPAVPAILVYVSAVSVTALIQIV